MSEESNYLVNKKVNIKQTLLANTFYVAFLIMPISFFIMGVEMAKTIVDPHGQTMVTIFSMYFILRIIFFMGQPQFVYDEELIPKKSVANKG